MTDGNKKYYYGLGDLKKKERVYFEDFFLKKDFSTKEWFMVGKDIKSKRWFIISTANSDYKKAKNILKMFRGCIRKDEIHYFEKFEFTDGIWQGKIDKELILTKNWYKRFLHAINWFETDHITLRVW